MKCLLYILFLVASIGQSQVTLIPDQGFEQTLLDQNIDSDGVLNGQVLTVDISGLLSLSLINNFINDLSGLEDFVSLEVLDVSNIYDFEAVGDLDLSQNTTLKKFTMYGGGDAINNNVKKIILNNNLAIDTIHAPDNWLLRELDLKTGSTDASNLDIDILIIPFNLWGDNNEVFNNDLFCIKVTDETAATAGTGVYSTWTITADDNPYYFSETCALSTNRFKNAEITIYPNPTTDLLHIESDNFQFNTIKIFNLQGQQIKKLQNSNDAIDVSNLSQGLYILHIESEDGFVKKKFLKE